MSRLGLLGGTTDRGAAEDRPPGEVEASRASAEARRQAASGLIETHDRVFRRTARRYSICADDAEDAYQRALEILLTKAPPIGGDALVRWMQTVTKREALAVRRQRERLLGAPRPAPGEDESERDPLDLIASDAPGPTDKAARRERVARSREALQSLKPQEVRALTLKAQGYSYAEIGEMTGWSYTKINRCMAEGRKRFLQAFADIEQGARCEELSPALSGFADGEDANGSTEALRFHLRSCAACRAKLRAYRAIPDKVYELMPIGPAADLSMGGRPHEWLAERATAAVDKVRELGYSVISRAGDGGGDAASVAAAGGTRGAGMAAVAKILAICGATAAGGATCVATGVVNPGDLSSGSGDQRPALERPAKPPEATPAPSEEPAAPVTEKDTSAPKVESTTAQQPTPVQQKSRQFNFEAAPKSSSSSSSGSGSEFGGPSSGGGASSGGGGGGGGSNFGIE